MIYDILLVSLRRSYRSEATKWALGIEADSLTQACRKAEEMYPNLGLTPTATSMAWPVYPQPKDLK